MDRLHAMDEEMLTRSQARHILTLAGQMLHNLTLFHKECVETLGRDASETVLAHEAVTRYQVIESSFAERLADAAIDEPPFSRLEPT